MDRVSQSALLVAFVCVVSCATAGAQRAPHHEGPVTQWKETYPDVISRLSSMTTLQLTGWQFHAADLSHGEDSSLRDSGWRPISTCPEGRFSEDAPAAKGWYRATLIVPSLIGGKAIRGARLKLVVRFSTDGRIFVNDGLVGQGDSRTMDPVVISDRASVGQRLNIVLRVPFHEPEGKISSVRVTVEYPDQTDPGVLQSEIQTTEALISGFPDGNGQRRAQLDAAVKAIDFTALEKGDQIAFNQSLDLAKDKLKPLNEWMKQYSVSLIGNSHIDMAWLWPWTETVESVRDTFATALQLMDEYPQFKYTQSSVQDYEWIQDKYPAQFKEIQKRVKEGRWEPVGGMWVEPDLNMPDGESLVRQILVGKRYSAKELGVDVNVGWNPDSFGYSWQLPQIYRRSGFDTFITQKMQWNDTTEFPYKLFWWTSPDGSRLLTYFPPLQGANTEPVPLANDLAAYVPSTGYPAMMHLYGVGDHGGGPTRQQLDIATRLQQPSTVFPSVKFTTARSFLDEMEVSVANGAVRPPVWKSEMYLEDHRGCYTTQSEVKKEIRRNEQGVENAEKFAALSFLTAKRPYDNKQFEDVWKKVLFQQFHDIMPGSAVGNDYVEALATLGDANRESAQILNESMNKLSSQIDTHGDGSAFVVFNPLSWERTEPVIVDVHTPASSWHLEAVGPSGEPLLLQVLSSNPITEETRVQVMAQGVPSLGYEVIHVRSVRHTAAIVSPLKVDGTSVENEYLKMTIDAKTGCITSLIDKVASKETIASGGCGDLLQTFVDKPPLQDAWEIRFDGKSWDLKDPYEVKIVERGPERVVIRIRNRFQSSDFTRDVVVYAHVPRVDVQMQTEWHEHHILLKVGVPVNAIADKATFEIPYGTIQRPTTRNTPAEAAQFEVPAQRWADISDERQGFSLLNASKYGYDALGNLLRLSLLRSPDVPGPEGGVADQGHHEFTYAFYPHGGDWRSSETMHQGYDLNYPLITFAVGSHTGRSPARRSFVSVEPANVILTAVKKAEDNDDLVLRFYEFQGKSVQAKLTLPESAAGVAETDLMERPIPSPSLQHSGSRVVLPIGPYEIRTIEADFSGLHP